MRGVLRVFGAEWYRLTRGRTALLTTLGLAGVAALRVFAAFVSEQATQAAALQRALSSGRDAPLQAGPGNAFGPFVDGWLTGVTVATLLLLILAARALAADLEGGLLRLARTRASSRTQLVLGRALLGVPLVLGAIVIPALAAGGTAACFFDYGPVIEDGYELVSSDELVAELGRGLLATLPPLLATWAFGLLISAVSRGGTLAVSLALALYLGFDLFKEVLGSARSYVFAAFNPSFVDQSYLREVGQIARGYSDAGFTEALFLRNLWLPLPQAGLAILLACWALRRRPL